MEIPAEGVEPVPAPGMDSRGSSPAMTVENELTGFRYFPVGKNRFSGRARPR